MNGKERTTHTVRAIFTHISETTTKTVPIWKTTVVTFWSVYTEKNRLQHLGLTDEIEGRKGRRWWWQNLTI